MRLERQFIIRVVIGGVIGAVILDGAGTMAYLAGKNSGSFASANRAFKLPRVAVYSEFAEIVKTLGPTDRAAAAALPALMFRIPCN